MSEKEQKQYIEIQKKERKRLQAEIQKLTLEREEYIVQQRKKMSSQNTLDQAIVDAIKAQAMEKDYKF